MEGQAPERRLRRLEKGLRHGPAQARISVPVIHVFQGLVVIEPTHLSLLWSGQRDQGVLDMPDGSAVSKKVKAGPISADRLKSFAERIEKLEEERQALGGDLRDIYSEAKGVGYDVKTMRKIVSLRKMDAADRDEQETLLDVYKHALGMV